ncbi:MAG: hypothetical protein M1497_11330 [Nitrospirae bacterium]|nr:hypothetical protein [Nitrospirota bacterium]
MIKPFSTTGIGSLPHGDPEEACRLILATFDIPFWPQLPRSSFLEWMIPQYSEGMPFVEIDTAAENVFVSRDESDELERFYETCGQEARVAISDDYARGFHTFLRMIKGRRFEAVKGQITGPLTFTLGLKDREGRLIYFDEELRQISLMLLQAKARWQIDQLKAHAEKVFIFTDEPILSALGGSTYLGVSREETLRLLGEMASAITETGGIPGIHCCANADWALVVESGMKVISFDAYHYFDNLLAYQSEVRGFLEQGGYLAWGIVPTTDDIIRETPESVIARFTGRLETLKGHIPEDLLSSRTLLTPSCGTGSRSIEETIKVFQLLVRLKEAFA